MRQHGTWSGYCGGCRCDDCGVAATRYQQDYTARRREQGSGVVLVKSPQSPSPRLLDNAVSKVGGDFRSLGALIHEFWTATA